MSAPVWLVYASAIAGFFGFVAGVAGAWFGIMAYRRSVKYKALDLRLQLQKAEGDARAQLIELQALIRRVRKSRKAAAVAAGSRPSALEEWRIGVAKDLATVMELSERVSQLPKQYEGLSNEALVARLITIHEAQAIVTSLSGKYYAVASDDDPPAEMAGADLAAEA